MTKVPAAYLVALALSVASEAALATTIATVSNVVGRSDNTTCPMVPYNGPIKNPLTHELTCNVMASAFGSELQGYTNDPLSCANIGEVLHDPVVKQIIGFVPPSGYCQDTCCNESRVIVHEFPCFVDSNNTNEGSSDALQLAATNGTCHLNACQFGINNTFAECKLGRHFTLDRPTGKMRDPWGKGLYKVRLFGNGSIFSNNSAPICCTEPLKYGLEPPPSPSLPHGDHDNSGGGDTGALPWALPAERQRWVERAIHSV